MRAEFLFPGAREGSEGLSHRRSNSHRTAARSYLHVPDDGLEESPQRAALPLHHRLHLLRRRHQPLSGSSGAPCAELNAGTKRWEPNGENRRPGVGEGGRTLRASLEVSPGTRRAGRRQELQRGRLLVSGRVPCPRGGQHVVAAAAETHSGPRRGATLSGRIRSSLDLHRGHGTRERAWRGVEARPCGPAHSRRGFYVNEGEGGECSIVLEQLKPKMI